MSELSSPNAFFPFLSLSSFWPFFGICEQDIVKPMLDLLFTIILYYYKLKWTTHKTKRYLKPNASDYIMSLFIAPFTPCTFFNHTLFSNSCTSYYTQDSPSGQLVDTNTQKGCCLGCCKGGFILSSFTIWI